jgi:hypothetical protein
MQSRFLSAKHSLAAEAGGLSDSRQRSKQSLPAPVDSDPGSNQLPPRDFRDWGSLKRSRRSLILQSRKVQPSGQRCACRRNAVFPRGARAVGVAVRLSNSSFADACLASRLTLTEVLDGVRAHAVGVVVKCFALGQVRPPVETFSASDPTRVGRPAGRPRR